MEKIVFADRSDRGKLRVGDEQRAWFLDQVLTQSIQDMHPGEARDAAMITVHGRMQAYVELIATEEEILLHFEPELRDFLPEALQAYVFATRVTLEDATDEMGLILLAGTGWEEIARDLPGVVAVHPTSSLGVDAGYLWLPASETPDAFDALERRGLISASEDELETLRITNAVARWGRDMDTKTFPQEAGVDGRAVHYEKGCYLGQEAMAKIHFRGKVNRRLASLEGSGPLEPGAEITAGGQKVGAVTSASNGRALALVRHSVEPGTKVKAGDTVATVVS